MKKLNLSFFLVIFILGSFLMFSCTNEDDSKSKQSSVKADGTLDRTVLPISPPAPPLYSELDVRKATPPPPFKVTAPEDAPNVVIVLIDDLGFAGTSKFGGPVETPTFDRMASEGVYYNNFHTTAV